MAGEHANNARRLLPWRKTDISRQTSGIFVSTRTDGSEFLVSHVSVLAQNLAYTILGPTTYKDFFDSVLRFCIMRWKRILLFPTNVNRCG